jgi:prephenate dehydrogenase
MIGFDNILIYGLGLMGGSLSLAIKKTGLKIKTTGVLRSQKSYDEIINKNLTDYLLIEEDFLRNNRWNEYDLIIFSLPVDLTCDKINLIPEDYQGFITDLGSTKSEIIKAVKNKFKSKHNYYSSHPMTGSELSGALHSKDDLYFGKLCILTREDNTSEESVSKIEDLWKYIGSSTIEIPAQDHDEILSYLSHAPHILSSLLVNWANNSDIVKKYTNISPLPLSGGGFRDMSRIAGSNPEMWEAIISTNKEAILTCLLAYKNQLTDLIEILKQEPPHQKGIWKKYFESSKNSRNQILKI